MNGTVDTKPSVPRLEFAQWVEEANKHLMAGYLIDFDMAGLDDEDMLRLYNYNESPQEIVEWFALKYDLDRHERS